jgi:hypothetical protein
MTDTVQTFASDRRVFRTKPKPIVSALALFLAGILSFSLGLTRYFFVEAMVWTFTIWGALLLYNHLADYATTYEVTDTSLIIRTPFWFWRPKRVWDWAHINRMDLMVDRIEAKAEDVTMQIYHNAPGSTVIDREDIVFDPEFARIVIERSGLKAKRGQAMQSFDAIPQNEKGTYTWQ